MASGVALHEQNFCAVVFGDFASEHAEWGGVGYGAATEGGEARSYSGSAYEGEVNLQHGVRIPLGGYTDG